MQLNDPIFVVGPHFADFALQHEGAITYAEFKLLSAIERGENLFLPGQALQPEQMLEVYRANRANGMMLMPEGELATRGETHKHEAKNIVVTLPRRAGAGVFELDMWIDGRNEILSDHQTGQHVQGFALKEAARQSLLAVTEHFFLPPGVGKEFVVILNEFDTEFRRFTFPLPIGIRYEIVTEEKDPRGRLKLEVLISFMQAGRTTTSVRVTFAAYRRSFIFAKEHEQAAETLQVMRQQPVWSESKVLEHLPSLLVTPQIPDDTLVSEAE
ncbi:MAG: AfsA-related hotdog domain-containing protein [Acidobacteriota bacterium]